MKKECVLLCIFLFIATLFACKGKDDGYRKIADYYFPQNIFYENNDHDAFLQTWFGKELDFLDSENLMKSNLNVIRFTCLRTWHNQFSIKLYFNSGKLIFKMSNYANAISMLILNDEGKWQSPEKEIKMYKEIMIKEDEINYILDLVHNENFYNILTVEENNGRDGDIWIIETSIDGKYKVIERWCPKNDIIYVIGKYLITLSGEEIENL
jgi:hypothetical protein